MLAFLENFFVVRIKLVKNKLSNAGLNSLIFYVKSCEYYFTTEFFLFSYRNS